MTRIVLIKLLDEHAHDAGRAEVVRSALEALAPLPGVTHVRAGPPADESSAASWDVAIEITLEGPEVYDTYAKDTAHLTWLREFLSPRAACKKAWNFSL